VVGGGAEVQTRVMNFPHAVEICDSNIFQRIIYLSVTIHFKIKLLLLTWVALKIDRCNNEKLESSNECFEQTFSVAV